MITVKEVKTHKEVKQFIDFPLKLYKGNPYFVPPLYGDEKKLFKKNCAYNSISKSVFFLAYKDNKVVGRISGILQYQYNEIHKEKRVRFTRFDSIDDQEVATALFNKLEEWAKKEGMDTICGPLSYNDLEREGLLIEGFDQLSTFEEQYNFDYYQKLIENCGYTKEVDWFEFKITKSEQQDNLLERIADKVLKMNNLHVAPTNMSKKAYINKYRDGFFSVLDECYSKLYGVVPITKEAQDNLIDQFMAVLNPEYLTFVCDKDENVVAFSLCFPSLSQAVKKSNGKLTLGCLFRILKAVKKPDIIDLGLVAVLPEYQDRGVNAVMLQILASSLNSGRIKWAETNLNLETNKEVMAQWKRFHSENHKKRRSFIKNI